MTNNLEYVLINDFKCKRCGYNKYDKLIHTGFETLDENNSIKCEQYVCRNCDYPVDIENYKKQSTINITSDKLLSQSKFIDQGIDYLKEGEINNG